MDRVVRTYVALAFAIEQHQPGFVDGYYGPAEWRTGDERPLAELARDIDALAQEVGALGEPERRDFLSVQVRAMQATVALLNGATLPFREEVWRLYDVQAEPKPEATFDEAIAVLEDLLPGDGTIAQREQAFRRAFELPPARLQEVGQTVASELRRRTAALWELPEGESVALQQVENQPWSGYNWYLGDYRSRIELNTDLPTYVPDLPDLIAHEAYPGHHTERVLKEYHLVRQGGQPEHTLLLLNAPEATVSEAIAVRALRVVMDEAEVEAWVRTDLMALAGLPPHDVGRWFAVERAKKPLRYVLGNAALLLHEENASEQEVIGYIQRYALRDDREAQKALQFIAAADTRAYVFTYTAGGDLFDRLAARGEARGWFGRLLRDAVTPGMMRVWLESPATEPAHAGHQTVDPDEEDHDQA